MHIGIMPCNISDKMLQEKTWIQAAQRLNFMRNYRYGSDAKVTSVGSGIIFHFLFFYTLNYVDIDEPSNLCYVLTQKMEKLTPRLT